jgi:large subunit ribosomal protein L4
MPKIALLNQSGEKIKDIKLSDEVFGIEVLNQQVIYDVVNCQRAAMRQGTHDVKNRSEVRGGGRKPWRQKGTGRARQGSIRAPQWVGGGTVFGPTPRDYSVKVNRKVRRLGLRSILSAKVLRNELTEVDKIELQDAKTKLFAKVLDDLKVSEKKTLVVVGSVDEKIALASRNIKNAYLTTADHASVLDIASYKNLVLTLDAVKYFEEGLAND